ncbi:MAG: GNAT family N-acetyltransferase [Acidimicrobiales bacterium]
MSDTAVDTGPAALTVRPALDTDAPGLMALIGACFAEYEGCVLETEHEMVHLLRPASHYAAAEGCAWVVEAEATVVASVACRPAAGDGGIELQMLYVAAARRRRGLGARLVELVEAEARRRTATFVDLWSDTRFLDAHRLYRSLGYEQLPGQRELDDLSATVEYHFRKPLGPPSVTG